MEVTNDLIPNIEKQIKDLANSYAAQLNKQVLNRVEEMLEDDTTHYLIYQVLKVTESEGELIDIYQNKGRFLYKYAGSFLEEATILCFEHRFIDDAQRKVRIPNTLGVKPKTFEIDCLVDTNAYEIKWRDATTDGDHITKEHTRLQVIKNAGYTPNRIMFYYPNRTQAIRIQQTLETLYNGADGNYYYGDAAWDYIYNTTGVNLKNILMKIASDNQNSEEIQNDITIRGLQGTN